MQNKKSVIGRLAGIGLLMLCSGCGTLFPKLQTVDNALAAKYGVPQSVVDGLRSGLGIPDSLHQPAADQVVVDPYHVRYPWLDGKGVIVDTSQFTRSTIPEVYKTGAGGVSPFDAAAKGPVDPAAALEAAVKAYAATKTNAVSVPAPATGGAGVPTNITP